MLAAFVQQENAHWDCYTWLHVFRPGEVDKQQNHVIQLQMAFKLHPGHQNASKRLLSKGMLVCCSITLWSSRLNLGSKMIYASNMRAAQEITGHFSLVLDVILQHNMTKF